MNLLDAWADWRPDSPPFVLDGDREVLNSLQSARAVVTHRSWKEAFQAPDFCAPGRKLHLALLPQPFIGDVRKASIYILLLNPALSPSDYYGEYDVPEYREALLANLKQPPRSDTTPYLFLDPKFAWHGGFSWWQNKLARVMNVWRPARKVSFAEARSLLASSIASIELFPYHSSSSKMQVAGCGSSSRVRLAREFVADLVLQRVQDGKAIVIVTRKVAQWNLPKHDGVVTYNPAQARGAHLTPESPGGRAILKHLGAAD